MTVTNIIQFNIVAEKPNIISAIIVATPINQFDVLAVITIIKFNIVAVAPNIKPTMR